MKKRTSSNQFSKDCCILHCLPGIHGWTAIFPTVCRNVEVSWMIPSHDVSYLEIVIGNAVDQWFPRTTHPANWLQDLARYGRVSVCNMI